MIAFLRTWANQIIVALIIGTLLEMILPNGNNKKYIKMIIGLYILFTIVQPIITKITPNNIQITDFNYKKYFNEDILKISSQDFEDNNSKLIEQAYISNIKNDIEIKMKQKGYKVAYSNIKTLKNDNNSNFTTIDEIELTLNKMDNQEEENENRIKINEVEIKNDKLNISSTNQSLNADEKKEVVIFLSNEYSIDKKKIIIN